MSTIDPLDRERVMTPGWRRPGAFLAIQALMTLLGAYCASASLVRPATAEEQREFALVEIGGVTLGVPREWVLDPHRGWKANSRERSNGYNVLPDALTSPEPISISNLYSCCAEDRLAPIYPHPAPYHILLSGVTRPDWAFELVARRARDVQEAKQKSEEHPECGSRFKIALGAGCVRAATDHGQLSVTANRA